MSRLPIRVRVTVVFAVLMALVLGTVGAFIYVRQEHELGRTTDQSLQTRAADISTLVRRAASGGALNGREALTDQGDGLAQIVSPSGQVVDATPAVRGRSLLEPALIRRATHRTVVLERAGVPASEGTTRLLATPVRSATGTSVVVVGASLDDIDEAQSSLAALLLVGLPVTLLLAAGVAFAVVTAALRPIEAMRRRASEIQAADPIERLPVSDANDEVRRLGLTLNELLDRLAATLAHERRFVSDASHELRTPLAILKAELEVAQLKGQPEVALRKAVASASEEADRLSRLTDDLLVVARADRSELFVQRTVLSVDGVLQDLRGRLMPRARQLAKSIAVDAPADLYVAADRFRMEQALTNLVENSLTHGNGTVTVIARTIDHGEISIAVRDRGDGFPEPFIDKAFQRFTRADPGRGGGGAGLGLSIVEAIAHAHGGRASAQNLPDGGAQVTVFLPASAGDRPFTPEADE